MSGCERVCPSCSDRLRRPGAVALPVHKSPSRRSYPTSQRSPPGCKRRPTGRDRRPPDPARLPPHQAKMSATPRQMSARSRKIAIRGSKPAKRSVGTAIAPGRSHDHVRPRAVALPVEPPNLKGELTSRNAPPRRLKILLTKRVPASPNRPGTIRVLASSVASANSPNTRRNTAAGNGKQAGPARAQRRGKFRICHRLRNDDIHRPRATCVEPRVRNRPTAPIEHP